MKRSEFIDFIDKVVIQSFSRTGRFNGICLAIKLVIIGARSNRISASFHVLMDVVLPKDACREFYFGDRTLDNHNIRINALYLFREYILDTGEYSKF